MNATVSSHETRSSALAQNLHVLTLTPFYPTERDDASGCFVAEPLAGMASIGIRNTIFAVEPGYRKRSRSNVSALRAKWIRYFALPGGIGLSTAGAFLYARILSQVRELHLAKKIDVINAHAPLPCGHAAMLLSRELNIPYIVTVHGLDAFSTVQIGGRAGEWCRRISQSAYGNACQVICVSQLVREKVLEGMNGKSRTTVVYNGVDPDLFSPGSRPPISNSPIAPTILSVGNLIPIKGHEFLIRAVAALTSEFPTLQLQIIGDGRERVRMQALANELHVAGRVQFLGRQSRAQVADALRHCTLFALPSRYEALGCVYLEAMSTAKPVIACKGQGIAEVIHNGSNGLLVAHDNEKELRQAIALLLRDEISRRLMGLAGRNTILNGFTLAQQAENLARVYRECAA